MGPQPHHTSSVTTVCRLRGGAPGVYRGAMAFEGWPVEAVEFFERLEDDNTKAFWTEQKHVYEQCVKAPMVALLAELEDRCGEGKVFRPYRDVRFSKDKTPYKTNVGIQFRHERGKDVHAPGFYLHLEPGGCFAGIGMWRPETRVARQIRAHIYEHPDDWRKATTYKRFTSVWDSTTQSVAEFPACRS